MEKPVQIFRKAAVEHQGAGTSQGGPVLRLAPEWTSWAFWLLLLVVGFYGVLGVFGRVSEYASGPAVVRQVPGGATEVLAALPGNYRPLLAEGATMRLELQGFSYQYQDLRIEEIDGTLLAPRELREKTGEGLAERLTAAAPVVLVRARVPAGFFLTEDGQLPYFHGMQGAVSVRVKSERLAATLIPGLKLFLR